MFLLNGLQTSFNSKLKRSKNNLHRFNKKNSNYRKISKMDRNNRDRRKIKIMGKIKNGIKIKKIGIRKNEQ